MDQNELAELRYLLHFELRREMTVKTQSGCVGKQGFDSYPDAQRAMHSEDIKRSCRPYRCPVCRKIHIGRREDSI